MSGASAALLVAAGGAAGALARFGIGQTALAVLGPGFPFGTLVVNAVGGVAMGALAGLAGDNRALMLLLGVGFLGGFTTFSAFSMEIVLMIVRGAMLTAALYTAASVALAVGGAGLGFALTRTLAP